MDHAVAEPARRLEVKLQLDALRECRLPATDDDRRDEQVDYVDQPE